MVNDYTITIEIEKVQYSFLRSGDRVLTLSMRYASLALQRDMLKVGCNWPIINQPFAVVPALHSVLFHFSSVTSLPLPGGVLAEKLGRGVRPAS